MAAPSTRPAGDAPNLDNDGLKQIEVDILTKYAGKIGNSFLATPLIYAPIHFGLKRAGIRRNLYIPFAAGVSFLAATAVALKFTYNLMEECLSLPPSEYASSAELHFVLKRYGLVYIHQDGKKKYSILSSSEKGKIRESSQAIELSHIQQNATNAEGKEKVEHVVMTQEQATLIKE